METQYGKPKLDKVVQASVLDIPLFRYVIKKDSEASLALTHN